MESDRLDSHIINAAVAVIFLDSLTALCSPSFVPLNELRQVIRLFSQTNKLVLEQVFGRGSLMNGNHKWNSF